MTIVSIVALPVIISKQFVTCTRQAEPFSFFVKICLGFFVFFLTKKRSALFHYIMRLRYIFYRDYRQRKGSRGVLQDEDE